MAESNFTSGEWLVDKWIDDRDNSIQRILVVQNDVANKCYPVICECYQVVDDNFEQAQANAALLSAAKDMYNALKDLMRYKGVMSDESTKNATEALAKARGE